MRTTPCLSAIVFGLLSLAPASGQEAAQPPGRAVVSGTVTDSLARAPLAGAIVQLVDASGSSVRATTAMSDSAGRFAFRDVAAGSYLVGFHHPVLDSLGLEPILRRATVGAEQSLRVDLAIPGPARVQAALCGTPGSGASGGLLVGVVRDARGGAPVPGATVQAEWLEMSFGSSGISRSIARRNATTGETGWFVLCDVPNPGTLFLAAGSGSAGTDRVEVDVPRGGFLRRDLFVGEAALARGDAAGDSVPARRTGTGSVSGVVVPAEGGRALEGALIRIEGGPETRADERGAWTLAGVPSGTRILEARAPGYHPVRRAVDIVEGAPPVRIALSTEQMVLDTLRVVVSAPNLRRSGFEERRRLGIGRFLTSEDIARRGLWNTSELIATVPGLHVERSPDGGTVLSMRGTFAERCSPAVVLNGQVMQNLEPDDVDTLVSPKEIAAVEVYTESQVPPQFQVALGGCGSIVIWTK